ncbi:alpha/beta fold hydrolase [Hoeflea sp.]|uniref:alpha/beta fold hydrolase n=1 Tax=Hoeflea sp. TaxID=1940281 RepID=UPI003B014BDF
MREPDKPSSFWQISGTRLLSFAKEPAILAEILLARYTCPTMSFENESTISVNDTELAIRQVGAGDPLVLVHGGVSDLRTWSGQVDAFAEHYRTILYSRRYHCPNEAIQPDAPDPIQTHVDDLSALIVALNAQPAHLMGHSWGGLITLLLAMQRPDLCRSLVLIEPPLVSMHVSIPPKIGQIIGLFVRSPRLAIAIAKLGGGALAPAEKAFRAGDDKIAIERFGRGVLGDRAFNSLSSERYQQVWDNRGPDRAQALYKGFPDLLKAEFSNVDCPVLLVSGAESPAIFGLLLDGLQNRLPDGRKCIIDGASHIVHEDASPAFNASVLAFLEQAR